MTPKAPTDEAPATRSPAAANGHAVLGTSTLSSFPSRDHTERGGEQDRTGNPGLPSHHS